MLCKENRYTTWQPFCEQMSPAICTALLNDQFALHVSSVSHLSITLHIIIE
jgi:hypothetical protein